MPGETGPYILGGATERRQTRVGIVYRASIWLYIFAVILLSFQQGLTVYAKAAGLGLAGLFVFHAVSHSSRGVTVLREHKILLAWFLFAVLSSFLSDTPETALPKVVTLVQVFVIGFIITNFIIWNGSSTFYWMGITLAALVSGAVTLSDPASFSSIDGRIYGTLDNPNNFAAMMAMCVGLCLSFAFGRRPAIARIAAAVLAAGFFYLVARSGSRAGMIASIVSIAALMVCWYVSQKGKGIGKRLAVAIVGVSILAGTGVYLASTEFSERLFRLLDVVGSGDLSATKETSLTSRAWMMRRGIQLAAENPIFGAGLDAFRTEQVTAGQRVGFNSHSNYVEVFASTGLIGGVMYFTIYYFWISQLWRLRRVLTEERMAAHYARIVACIGLLVILDLGQVTYYHKIPWLLIAGFMADLQILSAQSRAAYGSTTNGARYYR